MVARPGLTAAEQEDDDDGGKVLQPLYAAGTNGREVLPRGGASICDKV
jgi:hypothetical protein